MTTASGTLPTNFDSGRYRLEHELGRGGMGIVFCARHVALDEPVAIKVVLPERLARAKSSVARFLSEARAVARITSLHVPRVIDVGVSRSGAPYLVMERLEGTSLEKVVRGERSVSGLVDIVLEACDALAEAHSLGIVHRDVKTSNIFLSTSGAEKKERVKLLDFGVAKNPDRVGDANETGPQEFLGSPAYSAPEQLRSARSVDGRADIWSLGVVLYELLTGELPFNAPTLPELCTRVIEEDPTPVSMLAPEVPSGLADVVARCLQKDPSRRYGSILPLARALAPFATKRGARLVSRIEAVSEAFSDTGQSMTQRLVVPPSFASLSSLPAVPSSSPILSATTSSVPYLPCAPSSSSLLVPAESRPSPFAATTASSPAPLQSQRPRARWIGGAAALALTLVIGLGLGAWLGARHPARDPARGVSAQRASTTETSPR